MRNLREPLKPEKTELKAVPTQAEREAPPAEEIKRSESLLPPGQVEDLRTRWSAIQTAFVDDPRRAVEDADALAASAVKQIAEGFADQRAQLEKQWSSGEDASTESLRLALQQYRTFFSRLLSL